MYGRSHTHRRGVAGGRWKKKAPKTKRIFKANLQPTTIIEKGQELQVKLCAKCIKRIKKDISEGKKPFLLVKNFIKKSAHTEKEKAPLEEKAKRKKQAKEK